jgi:hypothetical protein
MRQVGVGYGKDEKWITKFLLENMKEGGNLEDYV